MLKLLVQWLKKFLNLTLSAKQTLSVKVMGENQVVQQPPELTNADLEFLFTQLLEGVYQARGQQWALKYLQRVEHRISLDRWIDWLLDFGERLLTSPAPNNLIAERMIQLGELQIGTIGELAYDIGIRLLTRNLGEEYWQSAVENNFDEVAESVPIAVPVADIVPLEDEEWTENFEEWYLEEGQQHNGEPTPPLCLPSTPGIDLIRDLGELLWHNEGEDVPTTRLKSLFYPSETLQEGIVTATATATNFIPPREEEEETWVKESLQAAGAITLDESWVNAPPAVESTLDDLLVRLEQSTNLVQQLAVGLGIQTTDPHAIIEALSNQSNASSAHAQAWYYHGLQQAKIGDLSGALTSYDKAVELKPDAYEYWFNRGLTLYYLGNFTEAIASYDKALEIKPDFHKGWYNRGATLGELGRFEEAIAAFNEAIEVKADYHEAWSGRGLAQLRLKRFAEAISSFDYALNLQPQDPENWYFRGFTLAEGGQNHEAIAAFDQAIEINPDFYLAWYYRGVTLANLGNLQEAITNYHQAIEIYPDFHEAWYALGGAREKLGHIQEAIEAYDQAIRIKPDYHNAWLDRGVVFASLGQWEDAIASWDQAIAINRNFYLTWFNRGIALDNLGRREDAIASYDKAIEINPEFHLAWYNRGVAEFYLGRFAEAVASYDGALQIKQDYWEAWLGRGNAAANAENLHQHLRLSNIAASNPDLKEGGYNGRLASYQEGLKYVRQDIHPEGWGRLQLAIANAYYDLGKTHSTPRSYWPQGVTAYKQALVNLTPAEFPLLHLEVLQNLVKTLVVLGETAAAQEYHQRATDFLQSLLNETTRSDESKKQLALKFAGLGQLTLDIAIQTGELAQALEIAEYSKNSCLTWLLGGWTEEIISPTYSEIQQLLNRNTAIIYWHISPCTLRTFVVKYKSPEPIPIFTPVLNFASIDELPVPEAVARLIEFEDWLEDWNQQYQDYQNQAGDKNSKSKHSWYVDMEQRLLQLKNILNISATIRELEDINQLILIPHRDLHKLPLHALFQLCSPGERIGQNYKITYLPSAQIGLSLKSEPLEETNEHLLLSVEQPDSIGYPGLKFAKIEAETISHLFENFQRIQGSQATKMQVANALSEDYNIFHFIGKIADNCSQPYQSELVLADADRLSIEEMYNNLLSNYKLITLSAAETAINSSQSITTEYVGLVSGFLTAGVPHVINNLWTSESVASALMMIEFYRRIKQKKSATTALTEAITWLQNLTADELTKWYENLLNELPPEGLRIRAHLATELYRSSQMPADKKVYNHPYYWAGFKVSGNLSEKS